MSFLQHKGVYARINYKYRHGGLNWQDRIDFVLLDNLSLQSIRFKDGIIEQVKEIEADTKQQQFNADFLIMTGILDGLLKDLLASFAERPPKIDTGNIVAIDKGLKVRLVSS